MAGPVSRRLNSGDGLFLADCLAGDVVGNCVYITADKVAGRFQVSKADPRDLSTAPSIGVIHSKPTATICVVQFSGLLVGVYAGLMPQDTLWLGLDGNLTSNQLGITPLVGDVVSVQPMGVALASDTVLLNPQHPILRR